MKQVTIHSDGFGGEGTIVLDEDGKKIEGIKGLSFNVSANDVAEVTLELRAPNIIATGAVTNVQVVCPLCSEILQHDCHNVVGGTGGGLQGTGIHIPQVNVVPGPTVPPPPMPTPVIRPARSRQCTSWYNSGSLPNMRCERDAGHANGPAGMPGITHEAVNPVTNQLVVWTI